MKILAIEHELPEATAEKFGQFSRLEAARAWELHQQGILRELYFRADRDEAVLVLECDSLMPRNRRWIPCPWWNTA
jgi:hypothetical protein